MNNTTITPEDSAVLAWLCSVKNFNGRLGMRFINSVPKPSDILNLPEDILQNMLPPAALNAFLKAKKESSVNSIQDALQRCGASFVSYYDSTYPNHLKSIPDAPLGIFYRGKLPSDSIPSVAVIGARSCSEYGAHVATELGSYLGSMGIQVISGMACGIDGISQRAAIQAGGTSFGVLGSGVDVCYPPSNRPLYDSLLINGGIISTYAMGEPAIASNFPPRNRIVSGLADAIVVIEARQKSGTMITVDMALEQGREVYTVPGRITDRLSDGCNGLIGQGAGIYLSPEIFVTELLESLEDNPFLSKERLHRTFNGTEAIPQGLSEDQAAVYSVLSLTPLNIDEICEKINSPVPYSYSQVSMILMQLMLDNHAKQVSQGCFTKIL
ncbi:MAG: DNA-processing protein DprA [Lachnospiraceae bacterium]|nr:DNA-processing protein DprA [Lachnospiraceae bacterium]